MNKCVTFLIVFFLKLLLIGILLFTLSPSPDDSINCSQPGKQCFRAPKNCTGSDCKFTYSVKFDGPWMEVEMWGTNVTEQEYIAIEYQTKDTIGNECVVFCGKDNTKPEGFIAGISYNYIPYSGKYDSKKECQYTKNGKHCNSIVSFIGKPNGWRDKFYKFMGKTLEHRIVNDTMYCRLRHTIKPLDVNYQNPTNLTLLYSHGLIIDNYIQLDKIKNRGIIGQLVLPEKVEVMPYPDDAPPSE